MDKTEIKKVSSSDIADLQSVSRKTFFETFSEENTESDMKKYLDDSFSIEKLTTELKNPESVFYFAINNNSITGYLKINFGQAQTEMKGQNSIEIERIYVLKEYQGRKVGQLLYDTALMMAKKAKAQYVWLGVWEKNSRALIFYRKNGFTEFDRHIFRLGDDEQTDIMMKLEIDYRHTK
jgi:diamine N-acetyltransferase